MLGQLQRGSPNRSAESASPTCPHAPPLTCADPAWRCLRAWRSLLGSGKGIAKGHPRGRQVASPSSIRRPPPPVGGGWCVSEVMAWLNQVVGKRLAVAQGRHRICPVLRPGSRVQPLQGAVADLLVSPLREGCCGMALLAMGSGEIPARKESADRGGAGRAFVATSASLDRPDLANPCKMLAVLFVAPNADQLLDCEPQCSPACRLSPRGGPWSWLPYSHGSRSLRQG